MAEEDHGEKAVGRTPDQKDAHTLERQAHHEGHPGKAVKATESKLAKHRDLIIVSISLLSLIIGFAAWKGLGTGKKAEASTDQSTADDGSSADDGSGLAYTSGSAGNSAGLLAGGSSGGASDGTLSTGTTAAGSVSSDNSDLASALSQGFSSLQPMFDNLSGELSSIQSSLQDQQDLDATPKGFQLDPTLPLTFNRANKTVYQVEADGTSVALTAQQYASLGAPGYTPFGSYPKAPPKKPVPVRKKPPIKRPVLPVRKKAPVKKSTPVRKKAPVKKPIIRRPARPVAKKK